MHAGAYGAVNRRTYGIQGDAVNLSARLMQVSQPGQILANDTAFARSGPHFVWEALPPVRGEGKSDPVPLYLLVRPRKRRSGVSWETRYPLPPLGRQAVQDQLATCLADLIGGHGQVVRWWGRRGWAKVTWRRHFSLNARSQGAGVVVGICQSITQNTPYAPWRQIFSSLLALESSDEFETIRNLEAYFAKRHPDWSLRLPLLGDLLELPIPDNPTTRAMDSDLRQEALFALVVEVLQLLDRRAALGDHPG